MARRVFFACVILGAVTMAAMIATVFVWMTVPETIIYRQSSSVASDAYSAEIKEHGHSYFITPAQKQQLDGVRSERPS